MKLLKPVLLALSMMLVAPMAVQAAEITLVPAVKLQIGDRDNRGYYWDGGYWRDHGWWNKHYEWQGNRWHRHAPPPPRHHKPNKHHNDHRGDHGRAEAIVNSRNSATCVALFLLFVTFKHQLAICRRFFIKEITFAIKVL